MSFLVYPLSSLHAACATWAGSVPVRVCTSKPVCVFCLLPQALSKVCSTFVCLCLCIWNESARRPGFSQSIMGSSVQVFCSFQAPLISIFLSSNLKKQKEAPVARVHSVSPVEGSPCKSALHFLVAKQNTCDRGALWDTVAPSDGRRKGERLDSSVSPGLCPKSASFQVCS